MKDTTRLGSMIRAGSIAGLSIILGLVGALAISRDALSQTSDAQREAASSVNLLAPTVPEEPTQALGEAARQQNGYGGKKNQGQHRKR